MTDLDDAAQAVAGMLPVGAVQRLSLTQEVRERAPLEKIEADMVGRLAREVHELGMRFLGWPTFTREPIEHDLGIDPDDAAALFDAYGCWLRLHAEVLVCDRG